MKLIDADKFLSYLIFSKYIDSLTCGEVKEAIEMCKVDVLDQIKAEIASLVKIKLNIIYPCEYNDALESVLQIIDCYRNEVNE